MAVARAGQLVEVLAQAPAVSRSTNAAVTLDLAAQAATRPRLMVLDEPTSGVAQRETEAIRPVLRAVADELGCAMLVVEHDMPFLMAIADRVYCLERGRIIAEGTPAAVREDPAVVTSYLGSAGALAAAAVSGRDRGRAR